MLGVHVQVRVCVYVYMEAWRPQVIFRPGTWSLSRVIWLLSDLQRCPVSAFQELDYKHTPQASQSSITGTRHHA